MSEHDLSVFHAMQRALIVEPGPRWAHTNATGAKVLVASLTARGYEPAMHSDDGILWVVTWDDDAHEPESHMHETAEDC